MNIDKKTFSLTKKNYIQTITEKKQIILGDTMNNDMKHIIGWKNRHNGNYKKTATFTVSSTGDVYRHFDPKYKSGYFDNFILDNKSIVILIENDGHLIKDEDENQFITWFETIYKGINDDVFEKRWRGQRYWVPYSDKQIESTISLVNELCETFNIDKTVFGHNTKVENLLEYKGILYKSNINKNYLDLNPSWDFKKFKETIENL